VQKGGINMMYPYITLADETEITHSQLIEADGNQSVEVHFERPTEAGFNSARCVLPTYQWKFAEGFSPDEMAFFDEFLRNNAHLLYRYAAQGGMHCA
jgi:hypothetical protein